MASLTNSIDQLDRSIQENNRRFFLYGVILGAVATGFLVAFVAWAFVN